MRTASARLVNRRPVMYLSGGLVVLVFAVAVVARAGGHRVSKRKLTVAQLGKWRGYSTLSVSDGRLVVTGNGVPRGYLGEECRAATVDPVTLRVGSRMHGNCDNPALFGQRVMVVPGRAGPQISRVAPGSPGGYRRGPVLFSHEMCAGCQLESIEGDGSLWIFAPGTAADGTLFRVSERSGRVIERWTMPSFPEALLAVNRDGLWLAEGSAYAQYEVWPRSPDLDWLYRVTPGARRPARIFDLNSRAVHWLVASGRSVWIDIDFGSGDPSSLWRLSGANGRPRAFEAEIPPGSDCDEDTYSDGVSAVVGSAQAGIQCGYGFAVRRINPWSGDSSTSTQTWCPAGPEVVIGRSIFTLATGGATSNVLCRETNVS